MKASFLRAGKAARFIAPVVLVAVSVLACSSGPESATATTTTAPVGPDTNDSRIVTTNWADKESFCEAAAVMAGVPQGETIDGAAAYASTYAQTIREMQVLGPDDPAFVTTMNAVKWAAETMETTFNAGAPSSVSEGNEFGYFLRQSEAIQGGPGVRAATARLNAFVVAVCGFSLGGSPQSPNLPSEDPTGPSATLIPPTGL
jgi:hypothetical protein